MKNKIRNIIIAIFISSIMLIITGCTPVVKEIPIYEGTDGLKMDFVQNTPPGEVFLGDRFPVVIDLKNRGAYDIGGANVAEKGVLVVGIEEPYIRYRDHELTEKPISFNLYGRSEYDPIGEIYRQDVELDAASLDPQSETHTTLISATACYPYKTYATATVCVDTDIYDQKMVEKVCRPTTLNMGTYDKEGQTLPKGQGAPIAVTKIEQKMLPHDDPQLVRAQYLIYVTNMGEGIPVRIENYREACSPNVGKDTLNVIRAKVYLKDKSTGQLNCIPKISNYQGPDGYLKLEKDEDYIKCTFEGGIEKTLGTFTSPLMIELDYGYTQTISKSIMIKR